MGLIAFGDVLVDPETFRLSKGGRPVHLEPKCFTLLLTLLEAPALLVTKERLLTRVWPNTFVTPNTLARAIAQLRRGLGDSSTTPRYIETVHTQGYRFIAPVRAAARHDAPQAVRHASSLALAAVPAPISTLIGREADLDRVKEALSIARLVTLTGPGGIGKTQLGLEAARRSADGFSDGTCFVDFSRYAAGTDVCQIVATVLDLGEEGECGNDCTVAIARALRDRRLLLVLDNCEHLVEGCAALARVLLRECPALSILATSQRPVGIAGEAVVPVPSLEVPSTNPAAVSDLAGLSTISSVRLFVSRARNLLPSFDLGSQASTGAAVADICRRLDGIPLAIELAAARINALSPEQIAARLEDRFALLTNGQTTLGRHQTLQAAMEWSYHLLPDAERVLLERLSVFAGGWSLTAADSVCTDADLPRDRIVDVLGSLVNRSFVIADIDDDGYRYKLLETTRSYAGLRLQESGGGDRIRARHFHYFLDVARTADRAIRGMAQAQGLTELDRDQANMTGACEWALAAPDRAAHALPLVVALQGYWQCRSRFVEARAWLTRVLNGAATAGPGDRAAALVALAWIEYLAGDRGARACATEALALVAPNDLRTRAIALSVCAGLDAEPERRESTERAALRFARASGDQRTLGMVRLAAGLSAARLRQHEQAARHFAGVRRVLMPSGDRWLMKYATIYEGLAWYLLGNVSRAASLVASGLTMAQELRDRRATAACLEAFGYIALKRRAPQLACKLMGAADSLRETTGVPLTDPWIALNRSARRDLRTRLGSGAARTWELGRHAPLRPLVAEAIKEVVGRTRRSFG